MTKPKQGRPVQIQGAKVVKVTLGAVHREIAARFDANNLSNGIRKAIERAGLEAGKTPWIPVRRQSPNSS